MYNRPPAFTLFRDKFNIDCSGYPAASYLHGASSSPFTMCDGYLNDDATTATAASASGPL